MSNTIQNRRGRFYVTRDFLMSRPEDLLSLFGLCVVYRAEMLYERDAVEYYAMSRLFEEVLSGQQPPTYTIVFNSNGFHSAVKE